MRSTEELGAIVRNRRTSLGLTQVQAVEAARSTMGAPVISEPTYRAIETGRTAASELTLAAVSRGLGWPPDALRRIRDGEDPSTFDVPDPMPMGLSGRWSDLSPEQRETINAVIEQMAGDE